MVAEISNNTLSGGGIEVTIYDNESLDEIYGYDVRKDGVFGEGFPVRYVFDELSNVL